MNKVYVQTIENVFDCYVSPIIFKISNMYYDALKNHYDVEMISRQINDTDEIIICLLTWYRQVLKINHKYKTLYTVNTEDLSIHKYQFDRIDELIQICDQLVVFDYSIRNVETLRLKYSNIKVIYLPPVNSSYFNTYLTNHLIKCDKDIDILIYGSINNRRLNILNQIRRIRPDLIVKDIHSFANYQDEAKYLSRTKVVLNVFSYDNIRSYDFYRLVPLIYNNIFFISESFSTDGDDGLNNIYEIGNYCDYDTISCKIIECLDSGSYLKTDSLQKHRYLFDQNYNFDKTLLSVI